MTPSIQETVERLRSSNTNGDLCDNAADLIERLAGEAEQARKTAEYWKAEHLAGNARNERLTGALESVLRDIADYEEVNKLHPNPGRKYCWDSVARAHEALSGEPTP